MKGRCLKMQNIDENLRKMFISLSTNRDLRRILEYYEENGLKKENITYDFYHLMEQISTEEIADRISIDLYVDFEGINIVNETLDYCLCGNPNLKDVQIDYIAKRTSLDLISIELLIETVFELITEEGCFMHMFNLSALSIIVGRR